MKFEIKKKILKPLCIYTLAFSMLLPSVASLADLDINLGGYSVVYAAALKPKVNKISIGDKTVSGILTMGAGQRNSKKLDFTIHVRVERKAGGTEEKSVTVAHTEKNQNWTVALDSELVEGDKVTVKQEYNNEISEGVVLEVKKTFADQHKDKIKMPAGEIWIEQTSSNQVNDDEQAEAVQMLKNANPDIAKDFKSIKFSIDGTDHAYYEVVYTDKSTSGKIEAPNLKIKTVTETSATPTIEKVQVTDGQIIVTLEKEVAAGTKFYFVKNFTDGEDKNFCENGSCKVDKSTSQDMSQAVSVDGTKVTFQINAADDLELGREFGIVVKEPHKFRSCAKSEPVITSPGKVEVRDPHKLTDADKKAIDKAIRDANTVNGKSKLPDGTGFIDDPAFIEFDKDGNVRIISPNDVEVTWDSNYNPVYVKNDDGTYKVKAESKVYEIPAKDLVKNLKPDAPKVALSGDKKSITITPNLELDTDASKVEVTYTGKDGKIKTTTAAKADDGTWSISGEGTVVNGVITLPKDKVKGGTDVTAKVTDKGGIADDDTTPLTSEYGKLTVEETIADKVESLGGLDPVVMKKWVGDKVEWKEGVKAKDSATEENKGKINELLKGAKFEDVTEEKRSTTKEGDFTGKVKVTFDDDSEIIVEKQMLYVSNLVTSEKRENTPDDALVVEFKLGEGTKVDNTGSGAIEGNKDPVSYQKYKVKPNTNLKDYQLPVLNSSVVDSIKLKAQEGYADPVWNTKNFVASDTNKVFTATATKTYDITFDANTGGGTKDKVTQKVNTEYELPAKDTFTPPNENQEFSGWQVGEDTTLKQPGAKIPITGDTVVKAIWKPIEFKATFQTEAGASGKMEEQTVSKGSKYELPKPTFTAEEGKEFAGWKVGDGTELKQVGEKIDISGDVTLTATWKDIMVNVSYNANGGSGKMEGKELKKGSTYKLPANGFTAPDNQEFKAWEVNGKEVEPNTEITIDKDTEVKAIWKDIMVNVSYNANGGSGEMTGKELKKGSTLTLPSNGFTAPENQEFDTWEVDGKEVAAGAKIKVDKDTVIKAVWKKIQANVTYDANGGKGTMEGKTVDKGSEYTVLPNTFKAPDDTQEFDTWEVNGQKVAAGTEITVDTDTVIKAIWKEKTTTDPSQPGGGTTPGENPEKPNPSQPDSPTTPPTVEKNPNGTTSVTPSEGTGGMEIPTTDEEGKKDKVVVEKGDDGEWKVKEGDPDVKVNPKTGETIIPAGKTVDKDKIIVHSKPKAKPEEPSYEEYEIPGIKIKDHYTPTFPVYVTVPKTEKVEKAEEVPVSLETHKAYIAGYEDNTLRAEGNITRAEAAAMVTRLAGLDLSDTSMPAFKDMQKNAWYFRYINAAVKAKMLDADNGMMRPNDKITRAEFAKMLAAIDKENSSVSKFDDIKGHRYEKEINKIYGNNRIEGYEDGSFRPDAYLTRAESAAFLNRMFNRIADKEAYAGLEDKLAKFKDFDASKWYYDEMVEATNSHELTRRGKTSDKFGRVYEKWTRILPSDVK